MGMKKYNKSYIGSLLGLVPSLILIVFDIWFTLWFNPSIISKHNFDTIGANQAYGWMMLFIHFFAIPICLGGAVIALIFSILGKQRQELNKPLQLSNIISVAAIIAAIAWVFAGAVFPDSLSGYTRAVILIFSLNTISGIISSIVLLTPRSGGVRFGRIWLIITAIIIIAPITADVIQNAILQQ